MNKLNILLLLVLSFVLVSCSNSEVFESTINLLANQNNLNMELDDVPNGKEIFNDIFSRIKENEVTISTLTEYRINSSIHIDYYNSVSETEDYLFVNWYTTQNGNTQEGMMKLLLFDGSTTEYYHRRHGGSVYLPMFKDTYSNEIQEELRKGLDNPLYGLEEYSFTVLNSTSSNTEYEVVVPVSRLSTEEKAYVLKRIQIGFPSYELDESKSILYTIEINSYNEIVNLDVNYNLLLENFNTCNLESCDIHEINEEIRISTHSALGVDFITRDYIDFEAYKNGDLSQSIEKDEVVDIFYEYDSDAAYETYILEIKETNSYIFNLPNENQCLQYQIYSEDRDTILQEDYLRLISFSRKQINVYLEEGLYLIQFENEYKCTGIGQTFFYEVDPVFPQDDYLDIYKKGTTPVYDYENLYTFNSNSAIDIDTIEFPSDIDYVTFTVPDNIRVIVFNGRIEESYSFGNDTLYIIEHRLIEPLILSFYNMNLGEYDIEFYISKITEDSFSFDSYIDLDIYHNQGERFAIFDTHNNSTLYKIEILERTGLYINTNNIKYTIYDYTYQKVGDSEIDLTTTLDVGIYYIKFEGFYQDYSVITFTETVPDEVYYPVVEENGLLVFEGLVSNEFDVDIYTFTVASKGVYKVHSLGEYASYLLLGVDNPYLRIFKTTFEDFYIYLETGDYEVIMGQGLTGKNFNFTFEYIGDSNEDSLNTPISTDVNSNVTVYTYNIGFDYFDDPEQINIDITNASSITIDMPEGIVCNIVFTDSQSNISYNRYDSISLDSENIYYLTASGLLEMNLTQQKAYNSFEMYYGTATIIITVTINESN